jgi:3'-phosphoadenosine 5'-phosphosulfate sulfotransferase (PAPS reductase)/FAD synthetase
MDKGDVQYIASMSGGKDSTAMALHLMEQGIDFDPVFLDTGWEHEAVYDYVENDLKRILGKPVRVAEGPMPELTPELEDLAVGFEARNGGRKSGMIRWSLHKAMFPARVRRWCTRSLKIDAFKAVIAEYDMPVSCVGIRGGESAARAELPERELSTTLDCMVWRPIIDWSKKDVIEIHQRHGVAPNPLYLRGADRVGCWPCIFSKKSEVRFMAEQDPERISLIRDLEVVVTDLHYERIKRKGKEVDHTWMATWFASRAGQRNTIDKVVEWSKTRRGGTQLTMFREDEIVPGCVEWGLCDTGSVHG